MLPYAMKVLIILADDFGWGNVGLDTPRILQLMEESRVYRNAHAPVSWCSPTRWAIVTGRAPHTRKPQIRSGMANTGRLIAPLASTLPRSFKAAGYKTGIFGKWHLGGSPLNYGFQKAFWFPQANVARTGPVTLYDQSRPIQTTRKDFLRQIVNRAVRFTQDSGDQWFCYVSLPTPHQPIVGSYSEWVGACDAAVGRLVDAVGPDTLVIFTSDNGTESQAGIDNEVPNPNRGWKSSLWDGGTRVPLVIRHPDLDPGETDQLVGLQDLYATLGSVVGFIAPPDSVDIFGVGREYLVTQDHDRRVAIRRADGWKLHVAAGLLYHLPSDPREAVPRDEPEIEEDLRSKAP